MVYKRIIMFSIHHTYHPETLLHRDRVLADGGYLPDLYMLNQVVHQLKQIGLEELQLAYDPELFGYKAGVGMGIQKLYSFTGPEFDLVQNTMANQPTLNKKGGAITRNYIRGNGQGAAMFMDQPLPSSLKIYCTFQSLNPTQNAGMYGFTGSLAPGVVLSDGLVIQCIPDKINAVQPGNKLELFCHKFEPGNYSAQCNNQPAQVNASPDQAVWNGLSLFTHGLNTNTAVVVMGTLLAFKAGADTQLIKPIFNISYGPIFN